jgi:ABC-type branched-subunit amino acid transport system ATPase component
LVEQNLTVATAVANRQLIMVSGRSKPRWERRS